MKKVFIILALCALAAAMVPRQERAQRVEVRDHESPENQGGTSLPSTLSTLNESPKVDKDETTGLPKSTSPSATNSNKIVCAPQTPCAWSVYNSAANKRIYQNVNNEYCVCGKGLDCIITEDNSNAMTYVHRCRVPPVTVEQHNEAR